MRKTLDGQAIDSEAIDFIQQNEPADVGYTLGFSGGKDSCVVFDLVQRAGVKFKAIYHNTTVDPPQLIQNMKENYPSVQIVNPTYTMWELIVKKGFLPTRQIRFCCDYLKEGRGTTTDSNLITGVRAAESRKRSTQPRIGRYRKIQQFRPILSWSDNDVWSYIHERELKFCSLYLEGFKRLGCIGCPMTGRAQVKFEFEFFPKQRLMWLHAAERLFDAGKVDRFNSGQAYFEHWVEQRKLSNQCQFSMFDEA